MNNKGLLLVFSGPSGVGKGTVLKEYLKKHPHTAFSVSATTRKPRAGEIHGQHYFFLSREEFELLVENGGLLEHAQFAGNCYGTPREAVEQNLEKGIDVVLEIDQTVEDAADQLEQIVCAAKHTAKYLREFIDEVEYDAETCCK